MDFTKYFTTRQALINKALSRFLPQSREFPASIHQAMRYSVLGEGKRIRPILTLAACEAVGGRVADALPAACALEMIHAYSLVHDDLPAMDDDDFRRGKPSCHKKFGEAVGILTGDALLTFSFGLLAQGKAGNNGQGSSTRLKVIQEVARAIGTDGMIGGQVADVELTRGKIRPELIDAVNTRKTGALIAASVRVGALLGGASPMQYRALSSYGQKMGLVFQWVDDLLDQDGAVMLHGVETVRMRARQWTLSAARVLSPIGKKADPLKALAQFILTRGS